MSPASEPARVEGRRYRVLGTIGRGGFGTVYKAELVGEGGFSKVVALKVLNADVAAVEEVAQRLRDEARVLGLVRHRAVVQVDGLVQIEGRWTIVMEYIDGVDLKHLIASTRVPPGPALEIVAEVASGLRVAYEQHGPDGKPLCLLHRDIKPSNLTLTTAGEVKILDFGTARANFASREAKTQQLAFGTLDYMSPERLDFQDGPAGDVYALGAVLYEMLAGEPLGRTWSRPEKHLERRTAAVDGLKALGLDDGLVDLVRDLLAFDVADRPDARALEKRCRELRIACGGPWLSDWAADVVPGLLAKRETIAADETTGMVLVEGSGSRPIPREEGHTTWVQTPRPAEPRADAPAAASPGPMAAGPVGSPTPTHVGPVEPAARRPVGVLVAVIVLLASLAVIAGGGVLVWALGLGRPQPTAPSGAAVTSAVAPSAAPTAPAPPASAGATSPPAEPAAPSSGTSEPPPAASAQPSTPATPPKTTKPKPKTGRLAVEGDADAVQLVSSAGKRYGPGSVPVGRYAIEATFTGRGAVTAGNVTIEEGRITTVSCSRAFARCSSQ